VTAKPDSDGGRPLSCASKPAVGLVFDPAPLACTSSANKEFRLGESTVDHIFAELHPLVVV